MFKFTDGVKPYRSIGLIFNPQRSLRRAAGAPDPSAQLRVSHWRRWGVSEEIPLFS